MMLSLATNGNQLDIVKNPWEGQIYKHGDILPIPLRRNYIVDGIIPCPSLSILYGFPSSYKSFLLADMAVCVAAGKPWLEPLKGHVVHPFATTQGGVLFLDYDNGMKRTDERFTSIKAAQIIPLWSSRRFQIVVFEVGAHIV